MSIRSVVVHPLAVLTLALTTVAAAPQSAAPQPAVPIPPAAFSLVPPAHHLDLKMRADSLWTARKRKEAMPLYRQVVDDYPADGDSRFRLAAGLAALDRKGEAALELKRCLADGFMDVAQSTYQLAVAAAEAGRTDEALDWLDQALAARFGDRASLQSVDSFTPLRDNPRFRTQAGFLPPGISDRRAGWAFDLDFFAAEARRLHAAPGRPAFTPAFEAAVEGLKARIDALDDLAVALELQKIVVAHLADGHSVIYPVPTPRVDFGGVLPVRFYLFSDGLYVIAADPAQSDLVGRRVTAIGDRPVEELLAGLAALVSHDNDQGLLWLGPLYLRFPGILRALGAATSVTGATLTLAAGNEAGGHAGVNAGSNPGASTSATANANAGTTPGGSTEDITLAALPFDRTPQRLVAPPEGTPPAWLSRLDANYWHQERPDLNAWYAQFNQVQNAEQGPSVAQWVESLRGDMAAHPRPNLILDLRQNNGGNNNLIWPLVRLAAWHEMSDPAHRTWVITGRGTFSAAQNLVNFLDRATNAVFLGEPAASRPNFAGEDTPVQLPWSGVRMSISSRYWQDAPPGDQRRYVPVAMPVTLSAADWRANRDPVLEALREYVKPR